MWLSMYTPKFPSSKGLQLSELWATHSAIDVDTYNILY